MKTWAWLLAALLAAGLSGSGTPQTPLRLRGYSLADTTWERGWEANLAALPTAAAIRGDLQTLTAAPAPVGSAKDRENAEWVREQFANSGFDAQMEVYSVLVSGPLAQSVALVASPAAAVTVLANGGLTPPAFLAYGADGDVTAPLVYANYGRGNDFERLKQAGITVRGKIVIARRDAALPGAVADAAADEGAVAVLLYSDPYDRGYYRGDEYPKGAWLPATATYSGSALLTEQAPGDAITPNWVALSTARRLPRERAPTLPRIPILPLSGDEAQPLLAALRGPVAPPEWRGALGVTYHLGGGTAAAHVTARSTWQQAPIYNVVATLAGDTWPEQWVVRGNPHDSWTQGAFGPASGLAAMLAEARALGALTQRGWHPKRTLVYLSCDGAQLGLLGEVEYVKAHAADLQEHAVAFIGANANEHGALHAAGSPELANLLEDIAPGGDGFHAAALAAPATAGEEAVFLEHLGVAALATGYGGDEEGLKGSSFDDLAAYSRFGDPGNAYGRALAVLTGTLTMRLADAGLLPFDFAALAGRLRSEESGLEHEVGGGAAELSALRAAVADFQQAAVGFEQRSAEVREQGGLSHYSASTTRTLNQGIALAGRKLLLPDGLPGRPWYRDALYGPGNANGGLTVAFPGLSDALLENDSEAIRQRQAELITALSNTAAWLRELTAQL